MSYLVIFMEEDLSWADEGECKGTTPSDLWFEIRSPSGVKLAKAICEMCRVRVECLEYALITKQEEGIWGGLTPKERRRHKKESSRH